MEENGGVDNIVCFQEGETKANVCLPESGGKKGEIREIYRTSLLVYFFPHSDLSAFFFCLFPFVSSQCVSVCVYLLSFRLFVSHGVSSLVGHFVCLSAYLCVVHSFSVRFH